MTVASDHSPARGQLPSRAAAGVRRVLVFTTSWPREPGDYAGSFVLEQVERSRAAGYEVEVVHPGSIAAFGLDRPGDMASNVRERPWALPLFLGSATRAVRAKARSADVVHVHWLANALVARFCGRPWVVTLHGSGSAGAGRDDMALACNHPAFVRWLLGPAAAILCVSPALAERLRAIGLHQARLVPNGVDVPRDVPPPADPPHVLFAGRLAAEKGVDAFAAATDGIERVVAGDGPLLHLLPDALGTVDRRDMAALYAASTVLALPSHREGLPLVVLEAMAHGRPVVATPVGGIPMLVEHDVTGLIVPENDPAALRAAIERLLADPQLAARLGAAARERVVATCSWPVVMEGIHDAYDAAITR